MKHINIKRLSLKFKTNLYIAKIKEKEKNRKVLKGYNVGELFTKRP